MKGQAEQDGDQCARDAPRDVRRYERRAETVDLVGANHHSHDDGDDSRKERSLAQPAQLVIGMETELRLPAQPSAMQRALCERFSCATDQLQVFGREQWTAPAASGSNPADATVIC